MRESRAPADRQLRFRETTFSSGCVPVPVSRIRVMHSKLLWWGGCVATIGGLLLTRSKAFLV